MFWTNQVHIRQSEVGRWRVGGGSQVLLGLVNTRSLQLSCSRVLQSLLVPLFTYGSKTMKRREKERSRIRAV